MRTGDMTGANRPFGRLTISRSQIESFTSNRPGPWRSLILDRQRRHPEIPYVKSIEISRSIGQDAATATIVIYNDYNAPDDWHPEGLDTGIYRAGYRAPDRGMQPSVTAPSVYGVTDEYPTNWSYPPVGSNEHESSVRFNHRLFLPNRIIRTYQGYGSDNFDEFGNQIWHKEAEYVHPRDDSKLALTGTWLIDSAVFSTNDGVVTIQCRDFAKLLLEQVVYPPMIPMERFPLVYCPTRPPSGQEGDTSSNRAGGYSRSSNDPWFGRGASVHGHRPQHAFDGKSGTYWLSVGNSGPRRGWSFEWIETETGGNEVNEISLHTQGSGYLCYVSVMEGGSWQGSRTVPYQPQSRPAYPNGADINFVKRVTLGSTKTTIELPRTYKAQRVRVCFTNLWNSGIGPFPFRAAVRDFTVRYHREDTFDPGTEGKPGHIDDWSEAIKELVSWAGLTWVDKTQSVLPDMLLGQTTKDRYGLRAWGDFEYLGAGPIECTPGDFFLNKSFMEAINTIKDFLGCIFYIDEEGGAIFRLPNMFGGGNFITDLSNEYLASMYAALFSLHIYNSPDSSGLITRGQMAAIVLRFFEHFGYEIPEYSGDAFPDVSGHTHHKEISRLADLDIVIGFKDGNYGPDETLLRGEAAVILVRAAEWAASTTIPTPSNQIYPDVGDHVYQTSIRKAHEAGLMIGYTDRLFRPNDGLSRLHSAETLYNLAEFLGLDLPEVTVPEEYLPRTWPIEFHENANLVEYSLTFDDSQVRSEVLVVGESPDTNATNPVAAGYVLGKNPITGGVSRIDFSDVLGGQNRLLLVPGDASRGFETQEECQRMAELVALFILFTYRKSTIQAPAHPGLQLDDQVRVFERTTHEYNVQYVAGINTRMDLDTGEYMMDVTTHWLGDDPDHEWFVDKSTLTPAVKQLPAIIKRLGDVERPPPGPGGQGSDPSDVGVEL